MKIIFDKLKFFQEFTNDSGKISRNQFLLILSFNLFVFLLVISTYFLLPKFTLLFIIGYFMYSIITFPLMMNIAFRRLNDVGANSLYFFVPIYGFYLCLQESDSEELTEEVDNKQFIKLFKLTALTFIIGGCLFLFNIIFNFKSHEGGWDIFDAFTNGFIVYSIVASLALPIDVYIDRNYGCQSSKNHLYAHIFVWILIFFTTWLAIACS